LSFEGSFSFPFIEILIFGFVLHPFVADAVFSIRTGPCETLVAIPACSCLYDVAKCQTMIVVVGGLPAKLGQGIQNNARLLQRRSSLCGDAICLSECFY
jgi:hypothetical protein